ncbi:MAG TPA: nucleoside recognition domain-containing protein [Bacteroidota bacterium]|nr:nucleoside recognition domain-containing protein [Bacteroidota bacterium]
MLNHVWMWLIVIGLVVAVSRDINDEVRNTYRNGLPLNASLAVKKDVPGLHPSYEVEISAGRETLNQFYGSQVAQTDLLLPAVITTSPNTGQLLITIPVAGDRVPAIWKEMSKSLGKEKLEGKVVAFDRAEGKISFELEKVSYSKIRSVTRAALEYADTAVTISLGLIGVMALWLGVMKVAEEAGLLKVLTRLLTPVTKQLFPDVPPDHPAVGAMIMNIAANMLGLNNAATPLGLKAMEELAKLSPRAGVATNAMCTFLVINTAGLTLIPATAIAIRAAQGSADPGIIIGTSIFGAGCATVAGLVAVKILQRLPGYKKALEGKDNE